MAASESRIPAKPSGDTPRGDSVGFFKYIADDIVSGFLVFLIALPLCLGIALAYGYPAIAGVFTAVIGGILTAFVSNSELTIKGPAAGLIGIAIGCIGAFGGSGIYEPNNPAAVYAYRAALAVGVAAGIVQILFGIFRVGIVGEFFPLTIVHGMLAAIGVIIISKQIPPTLGVSVQGEPIPLLLAIPKIVANANRDVAVVGLVSLAIMFLWPVLVKRVRALRPIPGALIVLLVAIPLAKVMHLSETRTHKIQIEEHAGAHGAAGTEQHPAVEPPPAAASASSASLPAPAVTPADTAKPKSDTLVDVPPFGQTFQAVTFPEFRALLLPKAWIWVAMFALIGTVESMLTAKALDLIDPYKRKTNLDRDNLAVGIANTLCALIGAAPMISEIARSKANLDNGAKTRFANMWHGIFLIAFVSLLPFLIGMIPKAGLTAMLIFTGFRLAHPSEFLHMWHIGKEQLLLFVTTIIGVLATDLLVGIGIGMLLKIVLELVNGASLKSLFRPLFQEENNGKTRVLVAQSALTFSNWIPLKKKLDRLCAEQCNVEMDLSRAPLVDHTVMGKLHEMQREYTQAGLTLKWHGLDGHRQSSDHPLAMRKK